jgi:uncharacterized protein (DUF433 family)
VGRSSSSARELQLPLPGRCLSVTLLLNQEVLEWLSTGASQRKILADYPQLESSDFLAVYAYAAELASVV